MTAYRQCGPERAQPVVDQPLPTNLKMHDPGNADRRSPSGGPFAGIASRGRGARTRGGASVAARRISTSGMPAIEPSSHTTPFQGALPAGSAALLMCHGTDAALSLVAST
jgi:hypothetical protein